MKKLIRKSVFETNSSSSHSISLASEDKEFVLDTIYPNQDGIVTINGDEFGWEWFKTNEALIKASYVAQSYAYNDHILDTLKEVIMEQTGAEDVIFNGLNNGYVDHDSSGVAPSNIEDMRNFIFNKNSWLFGGNDNGSAAPDFYHVPEYRDGKMIFPDFKYRLEFEGLKETIKFIDEPSDEELDDAVNSLLSNVSVTESGGIINDTSLMWRIAKPSGRYFELGYRLKQDYSTGTVLLEKDGLSSYYEIQRRMEENGELTGLDYSERSELITKEVEKIPGATLRLPFKIVKI